MNHKTRSYRSRLREDQAEATANRIVEAAIRVLQRNPALLSIPAVAREAGVAVPTVYHHYSDKEVLIRAVSDHLDRATGALRPERPASAADLVEHVRYVAPHLNGRHALMAPAFRTPGGDAVRREQLADRVSMVRDALAGLSGQFSPDEFQDLVSIVTVLCTSESLGLLQEYLGLSAEDAGDAVAWAISRLTQEEPS